MLKNDAFSKHGGFHLWKVDLWKAFKQCPLHPTDYNRAVFATTVQSPPSPAEIAQGLKPGDIVYWYPKALPFGAASSPYLFTRVAHALVEIARLLLAIPMQHYLDDFWGIAPKPIAKVHYEGFKSLLEFLQFVAKPAKCVAPTPAGPLLGVTISFPQGSIAFGIQTERMTRLVSEISEVLRADTLSVGHASKLTGKLAFAGTAMTGRVGRAYVYTLYKYVALGGTRYRNFKATLSQQLRHALEWWRVALTVAPARTFSVFDTRIRWELWTDAALVPHGVGAVLAVSDLDASLVPPTIRRSAFGNHDLDPLAFWLPPKAETERVIFQLELLAALIAIKHWASRLRGAAVRLWIDNESARFGLISGYSSNPWAARIISEIWVQLAVMDCAFFVERVPTKENIADGPSRKDLSLLAALNIPIHPVREAISAVAGLLSENTALLFGAAAPKFAQSLLVE